MKEMRQKTIARQELRLRSILRPFKGLDCLVDSSGRPRAPFGCVESVPQHFKPRVAERSVPTPQGQDVTRNIKAEEFLRILGGPGGAKRESVSPDEIRRLAESQADGSPGDLLVGETFEAGINCFVSGDALAVVGWNSSGKYWILWFFPLEGHCRIPAGSRVFVRAPLF